MPFSMPINMGGQWDILEFYGLSCNGYFSWADIQLPLQRFSLCLN